MDFFLASDLYIIPPLPVIIIPTPNPEPPINITNAWITPYRDNYCIWIVPDSTCTVMTGGGGGGGGGGGRMTIDCHTPNPPANMTARQFKQIAAMVSG